MAKSVNLTISDITPTGQQVLVDQYQVTLTIDWIDKNGQPRSNTGVKTFPNILGNPALSNAWLKEHLGDLLIAAVREIEGVDA